MAFLTNAKRELNRTITMNENSPGPGEYLINNYDILYCLKRAVHSHRPPFNESAERMELYDKKGSNYYRMLMKATPGPGEYNYIGVSEGIVKQKDKEIGFNVKEKRFKEDEKKEENIHRENKKKEIDDIYKRINGKGKVKEKGTIKERSNEIKNVNARMERSIGPGEYDIQMNWVKNGIVDWSRMSAKDIQDDKDFNKDINDSKVEIELNQPTKLDLNKRRVIKKKEKRLNQFIKSKSLRVKEASDIISQMKYKMFLNKTNQENSYESKNPAIDYLKSTYQFFGSTSPRFSNNTIQEIPGPGAYQIIIPHNSPLISISPLHNKPKKNNNNDNQMKNIVITSEGPCDERKLNSPSNIFINNIKGYLFPKEQQKFGRSEVRFKYNDNRKDYPGPGAYMNNIDLIKTQREKDIRKFRIKSNDEMELKEMATMIKEEKYPSPPVGTYNLEYNTIKRDLEKKNNKSIVFKNSKRFENLNKSKCNNIGPGSYFNENQNVLNKRKCKGFSFSGSHSMDVNNRNLTRTQLRYERQIGPGKYDLNSYFDWNKKSFNIQYI